MAASFYPICGECNKGKYRHTRGAYYLCDCGHSVCIADINPNLEGDEYVATDRKGFMIVISGV